MARLDVHLCLASLIMLVALASCGSETDSSPGGGDAAGDTAGTVDTSLGDGGLLPDGTMPDTTTPPPDGVDPGDGSALDSIAPLDGSPEADTEPSPDTTPPLDSTAPLDVEPPPDTTAPLDTTPSPDTIDTLDAAEILCELDEECIDLVVIEAPCELAACVDGACVVVWADEGTVCAPEEELGVCQVGICDAEGACLVETVPDGTECNDANLCTSDDTCQEGLCYGSPWLVDDGNPCTDDLCDPVDGESYVPNEDACFDDDPCTEYDTCHDGVCSGDPVTCDDGDPCTEGSCQVGEGCVFEAAADGTACDDGDASTGTAEAPDHCEGGVCVAGAPLYVCEVDEDCPGDDDLCNGSLVCDTSTPEHACVVDPASVVVCDTFAADPCLVDVCEPSTGTCGSEPAPAGTPCDDGDACTISDGCSEGTCVGSPEPCPDDGDPCTEDWCDPTIGCTITYTTAACDDGDPCTIDDVCAEGSCQGSPLVCDDDDECTVDSCDPASGCVFQEVTDGTPCDDQDACTVGDMCSSGSCSGLAEVCPDDGDPCTDDWCDPVLGCAHTFNTAPCDDGNPCTQGDTCGEGVCIGLPLSCDDGEECTDDSCDPSAEPPDVCVHTPVTDGTTCTDDDLCTALDACLAGACLGTDRVTIPMAEGGCDDGNPCTDDGCGSDGSCSHTYNTLPCDDGNACSISDICADGECAGVTDDCDDDNECTFDSCNVLTGCVHQGLTGPVCDDGDPSTGTPAKPDRCMTGVCMPGDPV